MTLHPQLGAPRQGDGDPGSALSEIAHGTFNRTARCFLGFVTCVARWRRSPHALQTVPERGGEKVDFVLAGQW